MCFYQAAGGTTYSDNFEFSTWDYSAHTSNGNSNLKSNESDSWL